MKDQVIFAAALFPLCLASTACFGDGSRCGPTSGVVEQVIDGDTIDLSTGERVRYLLIDTPEISGDQSECYGIEARDVNRDLVLGQRVTLTYDVECTDRFGRLLAYVSVLDREVNRLLVERGYACVLFIPPNGQDRRSEFENLEALAQAGQRGMWAACPGVACNQ